MANLMENYTLDKIDEKLLWTILRKKGPYWVNSWSLRMSGEQCNTYGNNYGVQAASCIERSEMQTRSSQYQHTELLFVTNELATAVRTILW